MAGHFRCNSAEGVRAAVLPGPGIGTSPLWLFCEEIKTKKPTVC